jgi:CrcB protein
MGALSGIYWYVALGAGIGGVARYAFTAFFQQRAGPGFPVATLLINISGSLLLGFLMRYALASGSLSPEFRALLTTGFCGGYTTFSTFSYETVLLFEDGEYRRAALYVLLSVALALVGTIAGMKGADQLLALRGTA